MLLRTAKLFVHFKEVFLKCKLSPADLEHMPNGRLKELFPCDDKDLKSNYTPGLRVIREFMSLSGKFHRFLKHVHGIGDDPVVSHKILLNLLPRNLELLRCYCAERNRNLVDFEGGVETQKKIDVIMEQLNLYLGTKSDQEKVVECALYFEEYLRGVIKERNGVPDCEVREDKISMTGGEELSVMTENEKLKLALKDLKREHLAVCNQRDELNDLLGQMMYKNVRLKKRENRLKITNKKLKKKLHKKAKLNKKGM